MHWERENRKTILSSFSQLNCVSSLALGATTRQHPEVGPQPTSIAAGDVQAAAAGGAVEVWGEMQQLESG